MLGKRGYVNRDLPVYRAAFDRSKHVHYRLDVRTDSVISKADVSTAKYGAILCQSFRTADCIEEKDVRNNNTGVNITDNTR